MDPLRKYIRNVLVESVVEPIKIQIQNPPEDSLSELMEVISQYQNRYNPEELLEDLDNNMEAVFDAVLQENGHASQEQKIAFMKRAPLDIIFELKDLYKRPRPGTVAKTLGINWKGDGESMKTDDSYAYPSGHTCQAYYIALRLSEEHPRLSKQFFQVAEMVAQSRIDRGVHFPSDLEAGKSLAFQLYQQGII